MGKENQMEMESQSLSCLFSQRMPNASTISQPISKGRNKTSSLEACKRKEKKREGERECVCVGEGVYTALLFDIRHSELRALRRTWRMRNFS